MPAPAPRHGASPPVVSSSPRPGSGHATESTDVGAAHGDTPGRRSSGASPHGGSSRTTVRTRCMAASLPHRPPRHEDGTSAWTGHRDGCVGDVATAGRTSGTEAASGWITSPPPHQGESAWAHAPGWITSPPPGGWTGTAVNRWTGVYRMGNRALRRQSWSSMQGGGRVLGTDLCAEGGGCGYGGFCGR